MEAARWCRAAPDVGGPTDKPLAPRRVFIRQTLRSALSGAVLLVVSLALGTVGYHELDGLPWIDSILNASMILGGMGPVDTLHSTAAKLFASFYAIFCGVTLLGVVGVVFAPVYHRFLHRFHIELGMDHKK